MPQVFTASAIYTGQTQDVFSEPRVILNGALVEEAGTICWVGALKDLPQSYQAASKTDFGNQLLMPGLIDSHTHLIFAGNRSDEFQQRLAGKTYQEIAAAGGGILKTVQATQAAREEELLALVLKRLENALQFGVTAVEVKSGYGLTLADELKCLRVLKKAQTLTNVKIIPTLMAAHAVPKDQSLQSYTELICKEIIPQVSEEKLAVFQDVFCEPGYFDIDSTRQILETGLNFGLKAKIHVDEFESIGGVKLAQELGAVSCEHLLVTTENDIDLLAEAGIIACLLPSTPFFLGHKLYALGLNMLRQGVQVAIATDFNPGSSHNQNLWLSAQIAACQMRLPVTAILEGVTQVAARCVGLENECGALEVGKAADFVALNTPLLSDLFYNLGQNPVSATYIKGACVYTA